jgi:calpain-7
VTNSTPAYGNQELEANVAKSLTKDEALQNAIQATELFMKATKLASSDHERAKLRSKCKMLLSRAEEIKQSVNWVPSAGSGVTLKAPLSERLITTREEVILLEGSKLHGFLFPPWQSDPDESVFETTDAGVLYTYVRAHRSIVCIILTLIGIRQI